MKQLQHGPHYFLRPFPAAPRKAPETVVIHSRTKSGLIRRDKAVTVSLERLKGLFGSSQESAAQSLGVSLTSFKGACRKLGLDRWPYTRGKQRPPNSPPRSSTASPIVSDGPAARVDTHDAGADEQAEDAEASMPSHGLTTCSYDLTTLLEGSHLMTGSRRSTGEQSAGATRQAEEAGGTEGLSALDLEWIQEYMAADMDCEEGAI
ncbi:hypothetical protein GUITHDRAFT_103049 [Guillardia theta CCMP2712]|uniref:RWP-RK domain-containing protein n=1 Tax=Guillardia theta (strain CCMP2712) TaxID=905079 RepID=L1JSR5_GUITC|nr:hypothetical protein GUITHDRAFT_103049 [Guillardia theta CCMP2712]EKX51128.1 hypothetical protein GUITHDRAFT_103049 [Guillardia theta CCMP2712]|eukprot:XP_005838108.1 hypothetical protein GUITHDRAFT_103049 [Guillardia theta CCMP2712]